MRTWVRVAAVLGVTACSSSRGAAPDQTLGVRADAAVGGSGSVVASGGSAGSGGEIGAWDGGGSNGGIAGSGVPDASAVAPHATVEAGADVPIGTPVDQWTFLPVDGATCGNGTPTGVGVNRSATDNDLVILIEGGGACWDANTCFTLKSAVNIDVAYDAARFQTDFVAAAGPVKRDPTNPLSTATSVFVPYCTGDLHGGNVVRTYDDNGTSRSVHHVGARNMDAILARISTGLPKPGTVWVIGSSAGGYGGTLNLQQISRAFPGSAVHLLADCAPPITPASDLWNTWQTTWQLRLPKGCTDCSTDFGAAIDTLATENTARRIALLAYSRDATISAYFGFDGPTYESALDALIAKSYQRDNAHSFVAQGTNHVMLGNVNGTVAKDGTPLATFIAAWALGLPSWKNAQ